MARLNAEYDVFTKRVPMPRLSMVEIQPGYMSKGEWKQTFKEMNEGGREFLQMISTIRTDFSRGVTDLMFEGGKFKDVMTDISKEIGKSFTRYIIEGSLKKFGVQLGELIPGLSKLTGFFSGGGAASLSNLPLTSKSQGLFGNLAGAGGGMGSALGSAGGAMAGWGSALMGGGISAVGSIISGFMVSGAIKKLTWAQQQSNTIATDTLITGNQWWPKTNDIHDRLVEIINNGVWVKAHYEEPLPVQVWGGASFAGGGGTMNINISGGLFLSDRTWDDFLNRLVSALKLRGIG
jgi:hypothetical protein